MFSCNEKTKKSEYIYIYKYIRETDRQTRRPGLLKGEWGQGSWYTGPSPLGDSPAVILCLGEPSTSLVLLLPPPHPRPLLRSHSPSSLPSLPALRLLLLRRGWKLRFQPETLPQAKGGACEEKTSKYRNDKKKKNKSPWSLLKPLLYHTLSRHSPPSRCPPICQCRLCHGKIKENTHW